MPTPARGPSGRTKPSRSAVCRTQGIFLCREEMGRIWQIIRNIAAALQEKLGQADRAELAAAAAEKAKLYCGAFLGNGTSQSIPLGFRPSAVLLPGRSGLLLASRQTAAGAIEIIQQGFRVVHEDGAIDRINESGKTYPYLAFLEGQIP